MIKQEWQQVEKRLHLFSQPVELDCDGYNIILILDRFDQFKNVITVWINGRTEGKWLIKDCEERRRFYCPQTKFLHSKTLRNQYLKYKRRLGQIADDIYKGFNPLETITHYYPWWISFKSLSRHLIRNNKQITLISLSTSEIVAHETAKDDSQNQLKEQPQPDQEKVEERR